MCRNIGEGQFVVKILLVVLTFSTLDYIYYIDYDIHFDL